MASMSTKVPEEESLINVGVEDSDSLAEEDLYDSQGNASTSITSRRWRYGLCTVGILCAVALATRARGQASLFKTKNVNGVTQLQAVQATPTSSSSISSLFDSITGGGSVSDQITQQYHELKADMLDYVPTWAGGTLGETTTPSPLFLAISTTYAVAPIAGTPAPLLKASGNVTTSAGPAPGTTIINGVPYVVAGASSGVTVTDASKSLPPLQPTMAPPVVTATNAPAPDANQTAAAANSKSSVQADSTVTAAENQKAAATESALATPCPVSGKYADGTPCLQAYDYPASYSGYSTTAAARLL